MTFTRAGRGLALMAVLTLAAAASSGNNLLYLLYSAAVAALLLSWVLGRLNLSWIEASVEIPDQVFRGVEFPLTLRLRRRSFWSSSLLRARWGISVQSIERLGPEKQAEVSLRVRAEARGLNRIENIYLESLFPFGLFLHRKRLPPLVVTAYPGLREIRSPQEVASIAETGGAMALRKGGGEEFYGIREYSGSDDIRWINWKLSAKLGRPLIIEFAEPAGSKITVRLDSTGLGAEGERRIEEAASACRYFIDTDAEVRLKTPEGEVDYGKGLLHLDRLLRALALIGEGKAPRACRPPDGAQNGFQGDPVLMRRLTWLGAALIYASMFLIDDIQPWILVVLGPVLALSFWLQERKGPWIAKPLWDALSVAVLAYVTLMDWHLSGIIVTNTHLVAYLLGNRLLNPLRGESLGQTFVILFLAFFLISGQTINLWYFLSFLLFTAFAVLWLILASGASPSHWRRWTPALAAAWLATLGLGSLCFAATPRFETWYQKNPLAAAMGLDKLRAQAGAVSGFTENVSLGFFGRLKSSAARVMRVKPESVVAQPAPALYVRGAAFDSFDGRRWGKTTVNFRYRLQNARHLSSRGRAWVPRKDDRIGFPLPPPQAARNFEFMIFPMNTAVIFTVGRLWAIEGLGGAASFDATDSLYLSASHFAGIKYRLTSSDDPPGFGGIIEDYPGIVRDLFLQIPRDLNPKTADLARRLTAGLRDDKAKAQAIQAYLRRNYRYSTFSKSANPALDDFLFGAKSGNCEYFATAGAVLLRLAGIPSRLVAGFLAQDWNEFGRFYDVRQSQAHAWVEAYVQGQWILVDPTPPETFSLRDSMADRFSRIFNALQARWYESVIGYDSYVQRNSFYRLGLGTLRQALETAAHWALRLVLVLSLSFAAWVLLAAWMRRLCAPRGPYFKAQAALERAGFKRELCQTPKEYALAVSRARPALQAIGELADWHYRERYAGLKLSPDEQAQAEKLLEKILRQL